MRLQSGLIANVKLHFFLLLFVSAWCNQSILIPVTGPDRRRTGLISTVMLVVVVSCCITVGRGGLVGLARTVQDSYIVGKPCPLRVTAARVNLNTCSLL